MCQMKMVGKNSQGINMQCPWSWKLFKVPFLCVCVFEFFEKLYTVSILLDMVRWIEKKCLSRLLKCSSGSLRPVVKSCQFLFGRRLLSRQKCKK